MHWNAFGGSEHSLTATRIHLNTKLLSAIRCGSHREAPTQPYKVALFPNNTDSRFGVQQAQRNRVLRSQIYATQNKTTLSCNSFNFFSPFFELCYALQPSDELFQLASFRGRGSYKANSGKQKSLLRSRSASLGPSNRQRERAPPRSE